jgi:hypothetical protein
MESLHFISNGEDPYPGRGFGWSVKKKIIKKSIIV